MSRPAPKRRAGTPAAKPDTESVGRKRSASGRSIPRHALPTAPDLEAEAAATTPSANRRVATRPGKPGSRRATRRASLIPTPAVLGATALVIAGGGAVIVSSNSGGSDDSYATTSSQNSPYAGATYARGGVSEVSRGVDRETLERQTRMQVKQLRIALAEMAGKVQERADELQANQWVLPLVGYTLSAGWGETSYLWSTYHTGLDFSAATGAEIVSVAHGVVTETTWDDSYGNLVKVTLDDGIQIWYAHQTSYVVSEGQEVNAGDLIGYVGSTGNTTGPHLHLEVRIDDGTEDGQDVDPYDALIEHGVQP